jgi:hypothetical protein
VQISNKELWGLVGTQLQELWMSAVLQNILEDAATVPANWKLVEGG